MIANQDFVGGITAISNQVYPELLLGVQYCATKLLSIKRGYGLCHTFTC